MSLITQSTHYHTLKRTLSSIIDDSTDGVMDGLILNQYFNTGSMEDAYEDDLETAGPSLATEKAEGGEISAGTIREGVLTRYIARTFALKLLITEEAFEDGKYQQAFRLMPRLKRAMGKTADIDATLMLTRATDTNYPLASGQALASSSHPLANGGSFSNTLATPLTPSVQAVVTMIQNLMQTPGHDGITEGYELKKIVCPPSQYGIWKAVLGSDMEPEAGNFAKINVVKKYSNIELVVNKYWTSTTTNYCGITSAEDGLKWKWRKKPSGKDWVDEDQGIYKHAIRARWARGCSDPRGIYFVNA